MGEVFMSRKSYKIYENTFKSTKFILYPSHFPMPPIGQILVFAKTLEAILVSEFHTQAV